MDGTDTRSWKCHCGGVMEQAAAYCTCCGVARQSLSSNPKLGRGRSLQFRVSKDWLRNLRNTGITLIVLSMLLVTISVWLDSIARPNNTGAVDAARQAVKLLVTQDIQVLPAEQRELLSQLQFVFANDEQVGREDTDGDGIHDLWAIEGNFTMTVPNQASDREAKEWFRCVLQWTSRDRAYYVSEMKVGSARTVSLNSETFGRNAIPVQIMSMALTSGGIGVFIILISLVPLCYSRATPRMQLDWISSGELSVGRITNISAVPLSAPQIGKKTPQPILNEGGFVTGTQMVQVQAEYIPSTGPMLLPGESREFRIATKVVSLPSRMRITDASGRPVPYRERYDAS